MFNCFWKAFLKSIHLFACFQNEDNRISDSWGSPTRLQGPALNPLKCTLLPFPRPHHSLANKGLTSGSSKTHWGPRLCLFWLVSTHFHSNTTHSSAYTDSLTHRLTPHTAILTYQHTQPLSQHTYISRSHTYTVTHVRTTHTPPTYRATFMAI